MDTLLQRIDGVAYEAFARGPVPPALSKGLRVPRLRGLGALRVLAPGAPFRARTSPAGGSSSCPAASTRPVAAVAPPVHVRKASFGRCDDATEPRSGADVERSRSLSIREGATYFTIGIAALAALFDGFQAASESVTIGVYNYNRWRPELQGMLGDFTSLVPVCLHCDHTLPFRDWLLSVRETFVSVQTHAQLPISQNSVTICWPPEFTRPKCMPIILGSEPDRNLSSGGLEISPLPYAPPTSMPWGLSLTLRPLEEPQPYIEMEFDAHARYQPVKARTRLIRFYAVSIVCSTGSPAIRTVLYGNC